MRMTNQTKRAYWQKLIEEQQKSGFTQHQFCKEHHLKLSQFRFYRGLLKEKIDLSSSETEPFVPVKISTAELIGSIEIRLLLPNGFQCFIPSHVNATHIKNLIGVLLSC